MKVYILECSQGQWSDRHDWIVNVYATLEACLNDPLNARYNLKMRKDTYGNGREYWSGTETNTDDTRYDNIYATVTEHDVIGV